MFAVDLILPVAAGLVLCLAGGVGGVLAWRRARARADARRWDEAWNQIESAPKEALATFREGIDRLAGRGVSGPRRERLDSAHLGAALCLVRLKHFPEAAKAEEGARADGPLPAEDERRLCRAY